MVLLITDVMRNEESNSLKEHGRTSYRHHWQSWWSLMFVFELRADEKKGMSVRSKMANMLDAA
jgi:hypothetical protein